MSGYWEAFLSVPSTGLTLMLAITAGLYNLFVIVWFCCYLQWRDSVWWLALLNALAPLFFAPILIYFALGIIAPSIAAWPFASVTVFPLRME